MRDQRLEAIERTAGRLEPETIRRLAASYRQWRGILVGPVAAVDVRTMQALDPVTDRIRRRLDAAAAGQVSALDLEDATMAAWLAMLAATSSDGPATVELLAGPWREVAGAAGVRSASRTQADRVTFAARPR